MKTYRLNDGQLIEEEVITETRTVMYPIDFLLKQSATLKEELARVDALIEKAQTLIKAAIPEIIP